MRAVARIAPVDRRGAGCTCFIAVGERTASITGSGGRAPAFGQERTAWRRGRTAVAVVLAGLPVGVAAVPVQTTAVRDGLGWQCQCKQQQWKCRSHPAPCARSSFNRFFDPMSCLRRAHKPKASCAIMHNKDEFPKKVHNASLMHPTRVPCGLQLEIFC
jgi:hypothetical protein